MNFICQDCDCHFHDTDQNHSQQKFGQCPFCGSENIIELLVRSSVFDLKAGDLVRLTFNSKGKLGRIEKY